MYEKTILVTGGAGFIGSNFIHHLYTKYPKYRIIVLDCLTYAGSVDNLPVAHKNIQGEPRFEFWYGNVLNSEMIDALVAKSSIIVHFAAESHVTRSIYDSVEFFKTDVLGTQVVANAIQKHSATIERFIHISTSEVYGSARTETMDEEHPLLPMSPYAAAKCGADRLVFSYMNTYKIPATIVRPFNNYGPRQHLEKLIPRFVTNILLQNPLRIHGDGKSSRDFLYVSDTCNALDLIIHAEAEKVNGEIFNIGTGVSTSISEIAVLLQEIMDPEKKVAVKFSGDRPGQVLRHTCNWSKIERVLGWKPTISLREGLLKTIVWYTANKNWWSNQLWMRDIPITTASGKRELH
ncbi:GDP-mannose 4,6-dehydratase [Maridesulfovibrio sp.]|uniref:dTDP-glucose 4,6-dehydratase n=1 Tax=Maridesulfovibrio sp. TaxID=2795000 RepID=UPI0029F45E00|nr:GDP-mannose 4,6-dehydratase [Maridesulfovibrio sp.]